MSPDELRAKAKEFYDQADKITDAYERLPVILRAIELEADAAALERAGLLPPARGGKGA
jgi:hypothetical protein